MNKQGLFGALEQYWTVEPKPRLYRRNTYFEMHYINHYDALRIGLAVSTIATAIVVFWSLLGVLL